MPLTGLAYLITAICCVLGGLSLIYTGLHALFGTGPDRGEYLFIALMALSVLCFWSCVKFIVTNHRVGGALPLLLVLVPMILESLYVVIEYLSHVVGTHYQIYRYESRW